MSAVIRSSIPSKPTLDGVSREDLRAGEVVTLSAADLSHTTYSWTLAYAPEASDGTASAAVLSTTTGTGPITFTVDNEGSYLIRLVVDSGLGTEDIQFVRLRYQTVFGDLRLVAAGERRDSTGVIPVDADATGWADDQNYNLLTLLGQIKRVSTSGRSLYVDANRGRDVSNTPNDQTIAEGFADYSSLNSAIAAATALVPAPSATNPVVIWVYPGFYEENVAFEPWVHVVGLVRSANTGDQTVLVETAAGSPGHTADLTNAADFTFVSGINFLNQENTTNAVVSKTGDGTLLLERCSVVQDAAAPGTGVAVSHTVGTLIARDCEFLSNVAVNATDPAFLHDGTSITTLLDRCKITGSSGIDLGPSNLSGSAAVLRDCKIDATNAGATAYGIRTNCDDLRVEHSIVTLSGGSTRALDIHPDAGAHATSMVVDLQFTKLDGQVYSDSTGVIGTITLNTGAVDHGDANVTGALTTAATVEGSSIFFDNTASSFTQETVQAAVDHLASIVSLAGLDGSSLTLDTAYDGVNPVTGAAGTGSGRRILADQGAVTILSASPPVSAPVQGETNGQLLVEGIVGVGAVANSEIKVDPNPYGSGPQISGGALVYPDISGVTHRSVPAFTLRARSTGTPLFHTYNAIFETEADTQASRDEIGRVIVRGGDALGTGASNPDAGNVYIQGGHSRDVNGVGGAVWIAPGQNPSADARVQVVNPSAATAPTLTASNVFVGGVAGDISFFVSGVGTVTASILAGDAVGAVRTKLAALEGIATATLDPIVLTAEGKGPNAEILLIGDDQGGALNTALGDFSIGGTATFVPGTYPEVAGISCANADELTVHGTLNVTSGITGPILHNRITVNNAASPYSPPDSAQYIGVLSSTGAVTVVLPTTASGAVEGRQIIIKDEDGSAAANNITISGGLGQIDNLASIVLTSNFSSITLVCNGLTGASTRWFIV